MRGYGRRMSSSFSDDQLQPDDTLDERGVDDVLDEGMSPPERPSRAMSHGVDDAEGESLDERLEQEEPDPASEIDHTADGQEAELADGDGTDPSDGFEVGDERSGRLVADGRRGPTTPPRTPASTGRPPRPRRQRCTRSRRTTL